MILNIMLSYPIPFHPSYRIIFYHIYPAYQRHPNDQKDRVVYMLKYLISQSGILAQIFNKSFYLKYQSFGFKILESFFCNTYFIKRKLTCFIMSDENQKFIFENVSLIRHLIEIIF